MEELRREREQAEAEKVMPSEQILVRVSSGQVAIAVSRSRLEEVGFRTLGPALRRSLAASFPTARGSLLTLWREPDSNHRYVMKSHKSR